jgi:hypothetical protein
VLLQAFVDGGLSGSAYEVIFQRLFQHESRLPEDIYDVLDAAFFDAEQYEWNPELRTGNGHLDEAALRDRATKTLRSLKLIVDEKNVGLKYPPTR